MHRLAWFTPLPPVRSGISTYSTDVLPPLRRHHDIDVFSEANAYDFVWKHRQHAYDLIVYQLGNASCHDFMWPYFTRYPGLVVLHDAQLHQARAGALLTGRPRREDYRAEFFANHPDAPREIAEFVIAGFGGILYHFWPMLRLVVTVSRGVAVHNQRLADDLRAAYPDAAIECVRMGVPEGTTATSPHALREQLGLASEAFVFAAFGKVTPEKRIGPILRGLRAVAREHPEAHVLLVGDSASHYDALAEARAIGVEKRVTLTGFVSDADLPAYIDLADVCLCLRWPTSRETSASWLRCLARGKPTVITDLAHTGHVTSLDPRSWTPLEGEPADARMSGGPIAVSIDILDEDHSLRFAMRRLGGDPDLRRQLGDRARAYWANAHTMNVMVEDYRAVIDRAMVRQAPAIKNPLPHLRRNGTELARQILADMRVTVDFL